MSILLAIVLLSLGRHRYKTYVASIKRKNAISQFQPNVNSQLPISHTYSEPTTTNYQNDNIRIEIGHQSKEAIVLVGEFANEEFAV